MGLDAQTEVAIIGAGPYGLSLAAHLARDETPFRLFGRPMESWRCNMPDGMFLKSGGAASSLSDPTARHTLQAFCANEGSEYGAWDVPVSIDLFRRYALWFQAQLVPTVEESKVVRCARGPAGFEIETDRGERLTARTVVVCIGISNSAHLPDELEGFDRSLVSHTSDHTSFESFRGQKVAVLGRGQSALESAALLKEAGAAPFLITRRPDVEWADPDGERSAYERLRHPRTSIGIGWRYWFLTRPARPFHALPSAMRKSLVDTVLGPFGSWWLHDRVVGQVPILTGWSLREASCGSGQMVLHLERGGATKLCVDHVIAGTGYRVAPGSFPFLDQSLRREVYWEYGSPRLTYGFESTARGLYFLGLASAQSFGPVMRFVAGAHLAAPSLARRLAASRRRAPLSAAESGYGFEAAGRRSNALRP